MKKRIILALCSIAIAVGGLEISSLPHKELPVSEELLAEALEEEPEEIIIEEVAEEKVCEIGCGLPTGHEGDCVVSVAKEIEVVLKSTSMERDLKVKFVDKASGKVISGADFKMKVTSPSKTTKEYSDHDNDGIIWVKDIDGGKYTVAMVDLEGYVTAKTLNADVKKKIEYKVVEIEDEVKKESQVEVSKEDAEFGGADKDESTSNSQVLKDTVAFVESSVKEETKTTDKRKKDSFGQDMYEKQAVDSFGQKVYKDLKKDAFGTPMYAQILSEPASYHTDNNNDGKCDRCPADMPKTCTHVDVDGDNLCDTCTAEVQRIHKHIDSNKDCKCDGAKCGENMHTEGENGLCSVCKVLMNQNNHKDHTDTETNCKCDICDIDMHTEGENGLCEKCKGYVFTDKHETCVDADTDLICDICKNKMPVSSGSEISFEPINAIGVLLKPFNIMKASVGGSNAGIETAASTTDKIVYDTKSAPVYDEKSAPVYDTNSAKVYETEKVKTYYGWQTIDGATYYFDKDGDKVTGQQVIQGISYTFNSDGVRSGTIGIDVSKYQTGINWTKVKNAGINFVMIRCGYRGYGSGVLVEDPMYRSHISGAKAAGLRVGVYFFSQAVNEAEAVEEASMAVSLAKKYGINMPIAIDSEYANGGKGRADGLSKSARTAVTKAFCNTVKSAGYTPLVYASKSWFSSHLDVSQLSSYRIWVAHYADKCGYKGNYHIWQNTDKGKVDGVPGYVDMNISSI